MLDAQACDSCFQNEHDNRADYLNLLRRKIRLYGRLADIRSQLNDLHDAKLAAWDKYRCELASTREFEDLWRTWDAAKVQKNLQVCEREMINQIGKIHLALESITFAKLRQAA